MYQYSCTLQSAPSSSSTAAEQPAPAGAATGTTHWAPFMIHECLRSSPADYTAPGSALAVTFVPSERCDSGRHLLCLMTLVVSMPAPHIPQHNCQGSGSWTQDSSSQDAETAPTGHVSSGWATRFHRARLRRNLASAGGCRPECTIPKERIQVQHHNRST